MKINRRARFYAVASLSTFVVGWILLSIDVTTRRTKNWTAGQQNFGDLKFKEQPPDDESVSAFSNSSLNGTYRVAFLKTHKCGSSTVMNILQRFGYENNLTFILPTENTNVISQTDTLHIRTNFIPPPKHKKFDILCNHVIYDRNAFRKYLPLDTFYVSIVRDPFEQFVSSFMYYRYQYNVPYLKAIPGVNPISWYLQNPQRFEPRHPGASFTNNRMAYDFGFPIEFILNPVSKNIKSYLDKIDKDFHLVLIAEYFDESLVLMKRYMNWTMKNIVYFSKNQSPYNKLLVKQKLTFHDRERHKSWAKLDYTLYDHFLRRFKHQLSREDMSFSQEVEEFRTLRKSVLNFCSASRLLPDSVLVLNSSRAEGSFNITVKDCTLLQLEEFGFTSVLRRRQYPDYVFPTNTPGDRNVMLPPVILDGGAILPDMMKVNIGGRVKSDDERNRYIKSRHNFHRKWKIPQKQVLPGRRRPMRRN